MKSSFNSIDIINIYRSAEGSKTTLIESMRQLIDERRTTVIAGDFNICGQTEKQDIVLKFIAQSGFTKLNDEPTQIQGRQIDHMYINQPTLVRGIERYSPYYSDHDALLLTLKIQVCFLVINMNIYVSLYIFRSGQLIHQMMNSNRTFWLPIERQIGVPS